MKKFIAVMFTAAIILNISGFAAKGAAEPYVSAQCAALMCVQTGELIYDKNAFERHSMASTTKIMTALLAVEESTPGRSVRVKESMLKVEGTSMGLLPGDTVTLEALTYGMLLQSGNDAANVTAIMLGGDTESFASIMNDRAKKIGMKNTHFVTPSGLDDENHYSCAYDMALLGCEAVKNAEFLNICSKKSAVVSYGNPPYERTLSNHNRLLYSYDGALGVKTGFTKKSGRCLVSCAERDSVMLVAVTLNAPDDWNDHRRMLDYGFSVVKAKSEEPVRLDISVVGGEQNKVPAESGRICTNAVNYDNIKYCVYSEHFVYAPVNKGDVLGEVRVYYKDKLIKSVPITASQSVRALTQPTKERSKNKKSAVKRLIDKLKEKLK